MQAIDEPLELIEYNTWNILVPEGDYLTEVGKRRRNLHAHPLLPNSIWFADALLVT